MLLLWQFLSINHILQNSSFFFTSKTYILFYSHSTAAPHLYSAAFHSVSLLKLPITLFGLVHPLVQRLPTACSPQRDNQIRYLLYFLVCVYVVTVCSDILSPVSSNVVAVIRNINVGVPIVYLSVYLLLFVYMLTDSKRWFVATLFVWFVKCNDKPQRTSFSLRRFSFTDILSLIANYCYTFNQMFVCAMDIVANPLSPSWVLMGVYVGVVGQSCCQHLSFRILQEIKMTLCYNETCIVYGFLRLCSRPGTLCRGITKCYLTVIHKRSYR